MSFAEDFAALLAERGITVDPESIPDQSTIEKGLKDVQVWLSDADPAVREGYDEGTAEFAICVALADPEVNVAPQIESILEAFDQASGQRISEMLQASLECFARAAEQNS